MKRILSIAGAIVLLGSLITLCFGVDKYYAHQKDFLVLEASHYYELYKQRANDLQARIWKWEDRYQDKDMPVEVKAEVRQLQLELEEIKQQLQRQIMLMQKKDG